MISALRFLPLRNMEQIEIQDVLTPIILTGSFFGLIPNSVKFSKAKQSYKIIPKSIFLNILCVAFFITLHITFLIYHIYLVFYIEANSDTSKKLNFAMELVNFLIVSSSIYIYAYVNRAKYLKILNMIVSTWSGIPQSSNSRKILRELYVATNMILIVIVILILLQIYLNTNQANIMQKFVVGITLNMPQVIQFCFLAFYTTQVRCITVILARITEHCKSLKVSDEANMSIRQMEMVYMKVFEIKMDINKVFEGPILASLFQSFHALVNEAYLIYYAELHTSDTSKATVYNNAVWITCQFIKIYWLSYSGNTLKAESWIKFLIDANISNTGIATTCKSLILYTNSTFGQKKFYMALKIGEALHYMSTEGQELRWMMEVQHFSTMLKYQSMDISVFGYFSLNASLMFNMSASAMTYLIIMVQFA